MSHRVGVLEAGAGAAAGHDDVVAAAASNVVLGADLGGSRSNTLRISKNMCERQQLPRI